MSACIDQHGSTPPPESLKYQYVIVRSDLSRGVLAAQVGHAAAESVGHAPTVMVVLGVDNETQLRALAAALGESSLTHKLVVEDAGQHAGEATAIGIAPTHDRAAVRKVVSALPLVR